MISKSLIALSLVGIGLNVPAQILNPGFETAGTAATNAANWTVTQAAGGPVYAIRTNDNPHGGAFHFEVHLASTGAGPVVEFTQASVPVTGGTVYPFSFYANAQSGSAGYNTQWRVLWNAGGDTGYQTFTPGNNSYSLISNSITAPAAATSATVYFHFAGAAISSQSANILIDDVSLNSTNVVIGGGSGNTNRIAIAITPGTGIRWFASNSVTYQVQWTSAQSGADTVWNNLGNPISGNGATNTLFDPSGPPHNFYQVLSIQ
jgi:plastocyanin